MARPTITDDEVRTAMHIVLREAADVSRHPTITAVERRLGIAHPTFYRNFPHLVTWFKQQQAASQQTPEEPAVPSSRPPKDKIADLRRENRNLRATVKTYAEALRQLTLDYAELESRFQQNTGVINLASRRPERG
ncbi:hypothetical protein OHT59_04440 [Streptomyces sp. NBC_00243]|uniref:hypothetical protein n=1 Tax=Streptomyces sp. NBC_00243 TaxID=2975688 RepID=UPI002DD9EFAC|nr:hypothetical protein [Streptomyces sp. NBC_00243]WRZ17786.1 hypothetical protein OHT59_04440 [Streptomyces sp. NBC_00243]